MLKERHEQDLRLIQGAQGWATFLLLVAALILLPIVAPTYAYLAGLALVYALVAVGLNLLVGFSGQISFGHAGFFAIGAYGLGLLTMNLGWNFALALIAAGLLAAGAGYLVGIPAIRLEGPYLAIATSGFGITIQQIVANTPLFGGHNGLIVNKPSLFGIEFARDRDYYYLVLFVAAVLIFIAFNLARSHIGRSFVAVRDSELAAAASGINPAQTKRLAFAISAGFAGIAGGLFAPLLGLVAPEGFGLSTSIQFLAMAVVGGLGTVAGGVLGAVAVALLQDVLAQVGDIATIIYGLIIVLVVLIEPLGIYGRWLKIKSYWKGWPF